MDIKFGVLMFKEIRERLESSRVRNITLLLQSFERKKDNVRYELPSFIGLKRCLNSTDVNQECESSTTSHSIILIQIKYLFSHSLLSTVMPATVNVYRLATFRNRFQASSLSKLSGFDVTQCNQNFRLSDQWRMHVG
ncbi:hypothetical protein YC2023_081859 [Brassica napus]